MERHPEHFVERVPVDQDVIPPMGRDQQHADFEIYEEPQSNYPLRQIDRMSRRRWEELFRGLAGDGDDDIERVLGGIL